MLNIAIVDDEASEREHLARCMDYIAQTEQLEIKTTLFSSGLAFLADYKPIYDIVLMDVEMPYRDGMETARALREIDSAVLLIFVTNLVQYAVKGYEVEAFNYLIKPINQYDLALKMKKAIARTARREDGVIHIKGAGQSMSLRLISVRYVEVMGHYVTYHTTQGDFEEYITLKEAEQKLSPNMFVRCGRPYLVNLKYVDGILENQVCIGSDRIPISRANRKAFLEAYASYLGGNR